MACTLSIYRGNKLLGIEPLVEMSSAFDRITIIKGKLKYKRYTRYKIDDRIEIKRGYDERCLKGKIGKQTRLVALYVSLK